MPLCLNAIQMPNGLINVCGKCYICRTTMRNIWAFRMLKELKYNDDTKFVTLTYNEEHLPFARTSPKFRDKFNLSIKDRVNILVPQHISDYHAALNKLLKKHNHRIARYYTIGEYGDLFKRSHYHEILYTDLPQDGTLETMVDEVWKSFGITDFEAVNTANVVYTAKHQFKVSDGTPAQNALSPIFQRMSRYNGGIGSQYFKDYKNIISQPTFKGFTINGFRIPVPPYYKKLARNNRNLTDDEMNNLIERNFMREQSLISYFHKEFPNIVTRRDLQTFFYNLNIEKFKKHNLKRQFKIHCKRERLRQLAIKRNTTIQKLLKV